MRLTLILRLPTHIPCRSAYEVRTILSYALSWMVVLIQLDCLIKILARFNRINSFQRRCWLRVR